MADVILTAAGQVAGAAIGGPIGAAIGGAIGGAIGRTFTPTQKAQGPRLGDLRVTGTEYGQPIPWVAGSPRISGQIIWASPKREIANTQKQGKGGGGGSEVTTFTYEVDVAYLLTENKIPGVSRVWSNGDLIFNGSTTRSGVWENIAIYLGTDDQMPDPTIESVVGVDSTPAYRGRGYVVIRSLQLGQSGQLPNLTFEIAVSGAEVNNIGFLCQFDSFSSGTTIESEIGPNVAPGSIGWTLDSPPLPLFPPASARGEGSTGININFPLNNNEFRLEGYFYYRNAAAATSGTTDIIRLQNQAGENFRFGIGGSFSAISYSATSNYVSGGGGAGNVSRKPATNSWNHFALQFVFGRLSLYINGIQLLRILGSGPLFNSAGSWAVIFGSSGTATAPDASFDSTVLKYIENGVDAYEDRTEAQSATLGPIIFDPGPYELPQSLPVPWYEIPENPERLKLITNDLMLRAGYSDAQYEVDFLPSYDVKAVSLSQVSSTRSSLELLQSATFFEAAKEEKIKFFERQTTPVVTIPYSDLGFSFDGGDQEQFVLTNSNDLELPAQVSVQYANMEADYQAGTEFSDRIISEQESTQVVALALGLLPFQAKEIADKFLSDLISGQWRFSVKLPLKYAYLMPGDVFNVVARDGRLFRGRIQQKKDSQVLIELECVLDDVGSLDTNSATDAAYVSQRNVRAISTTEWETLDIPILRDADNNVSYYSALTPVALTDTKWPGGVLVQSFGGAFDQVYTTGDRSAIGECDTVLGDWTHGAMFDETNSLTVTLYDGELESVTRANMLLDQELNAAAVGADGRWEIIRFRNAELTGQTSSGLKIYRLSGLLRGQRGTEWAIASHEVDDRFVLLDSTIRVVNSQTNELNIQREIKGVTFNFLLDDVTGRMFTHTGVGLKPFSVAQLRALPNGSDIDVTWNRRTRLSYRYAGINPVVPLGEATEAYRVWIYDGSTLVRTENVTTESYTYSAADIASDGFASTDTIRIEVAQVSAIVGAGYIEEVEVIAP